MIYVFGVGNRNIIYFKVLASVEYGETKLVRARVSFNFSLSNNEIISIREIDEGR